SPTTDHPSEPEDPSSGKSPTIPKRGEAKSANDSFSQPASALASRGLLIDRGGDAKTHAADLPLEPESSPIMSERGQARPAADLSTPQRGRQLARRDFLIIRHDDDASPGDLPPRADIPRVPENQLPRRRPINAGRGEARKSSIAFLPQPERTRAVGGPAVKRRRNLRKPSVEFVPQTESDLPWG